MRAHPVFLDSESWLRVSEFVSGDREDEFKVLVSVWDIQPRRSRLLDTEVFVRSMSTVARVGKRIGARGIT